MNLEMERRTFLKLTSALALAGVAPSVFATAKEPFTVYGAPALPSLTIAVAGLQGQLAKQREVILKVWRNPDHLRAGIASGEFKVMMSPSNVGVNLRNQGQKVGMINILTNGITQLVSKKPLNSPEELPNKKVIIPFKNDMPDIVFRALLKQRGINAERVDITYAAAPAEAVSLFLSKEFDAVFVPEPLASACILKGKKMGVEVVRSFNFGQAWAEAFNSKPVTPNAGIIADVDFYHAHAEEFEIFHQDLQNALVWVKNNAQSAAEIGTNYMPAPAPAIANAIPHANLTVAKGSEMKEEIMRFYEIILRYNPKLLGGKLPTDDFFLC
ncbi:ABC transporter substrate-binding protein [Lonepinella sp. MS14437]|uniref:ABC transporter substrate-binding protein n=2 Tax=unclassified Lonepinella TaxID=2642006 RepID=UPI0036DC3CA3